MVDILANPVETFFGSFTATSTTLAAATSSTVLGGLEVGIASPHRPKRPSFKDTEETTT
jgi:hypothetical protein